MMFVERTVRPHKKEAVYRTKAFRLPRGKKADIRDGLYGNKAWVTGVAKSNIHIEDDTAHFFTLLTPGCNRQPWLEHNPKKVLGPTPPRSTNWPRVHSV